MVGIDQPGERQALGSTGANRGALLEEITPLLRTWWAGDPVTFDNGRYRFDHVPSPGPSCQQPLEVWFGGSGPAALARTGRLADGWLGSAHVAARGRGRPPAHRAGRRARRAGPSTPSTSG